MDLTAKVCVRNGNDLRLVDAQRSHELVDFGSGCDIVARRVYDGFDFDEAAHASNLVEVNAHTIADVHRAALFDGNAQPARPLERSLHRVGLVQFDSFVVTSPRLTLVVAFVVDQFRGMRGWQVLCGVQQLTFAEFQSPLVRVKVRVDLPLGRFEHSAE